MTRETKIGLLVGLAFIIVVGILLSDHMTAATERPSAALAEAGRGVQAGVSAPGAAPAVAPPVELPAPVVQGPPAVAPGVAQVAIVPPAPQLPIVIQQQAPAPLPVEVGPQLTQVPTAPPQQEQPGVLAPIVTRTPSNGGHGDPFANRELVLTARLGGEPLVPVTPTATTTAPPAVTPVAANNAREYKAQPGDTLSRIAALLPGGATKANRDAVVQLNPTLQKDPNKVIAGRTYLLPTTLATVPAPAAIVQTASPVESKSVAKADKNDKAEKPAAKADAGTRVYVVQKGDTLGRIAVAQLGSAKLVSAILELNKDVLRDGNHIRADMKLKLPAKVG